MSIKLKDVIPAFDQLTTQQTQDLVIRFGVKLETVEDINDEHKGSSRKHHTIQAWLNEDTDASWEKLVIGLHSTGKGVLAKELKRQYCPQFLPNSPTCLNIPATVPTQQPVTSPAPVIRPTRSSSATPGPDVDLKEPTNFTISSSPAMPEADKMHSCNTSAGTGVCTHLRLVVAIAAAVLAIIAPTVLFGLSKGLVPLQRYWKLEISDHFYTINRDEIGTTVHGQKGKHGYVYEGKQCCIYKEPVQDSIPLYRYWKAGAGDHFYTTDEKEIGTTTRGQIGNYEYKSEGVVGYCSPSQVDDTVPLYRYWNPKNSDHFYITNGMQEIGTITDGERGNHGYISEGVVCYVYDPTCIDSH
jgi:hypothetical protein